MCPIWCAVLDRFFAFSETIARLHEGMEIVVLRGARPDRSIDKSDHAIPSIQLWRLMNNIPTMRKTALLFALALIFALPIISAAQGRGNGRGQGPNLDKKCAKFVNCHDARDGRLDGRGPAVNPNVSPVYQPPVPVYQPPVVDPYRNRRNQNTGSNNQVYYPRSRNRQVNRDDNDDNDQGSTSRHRRNGTNDTETRRRRIHRRDRSNVIE
jgi:hypothetical protein